MKIIVATGRFKKDIKRYSNRLDKLRKLYEIVKILASGEPIPKENRPHRLIGDYKGFMECHIESDLLLIWLDEMENTIKLIRFGTHSELFE